MWKPRRFPLPPRRDICYAQPCAVAVVEGATVRAFLSSLLNDGTAAVAFAVLISIVHGGSSRR